MWHALTLLSCSDFSIRSVLLTCIAWHLIEFLEQKYYSAKFPAIWPARISSPLKIQIGAADVLTIIYPLWRLSMPAMLKGYVDRVCARGFAYDSDKGVVRGPLAGKKAILITLSGAPVPLLQKSGNWNAVQMLQDTHVLRAVGYELLEHLHFDDVISPMPNEIGAAHLQSTRLCAQAHFG